jgi:heme/copper-type cytochrome/quinol oxidase subunit 2
MLPALITIPVFVYFELKPFMSIFAILFIGNLVIGLYPLVVIALRGPETAPLRTPSRHDEVRHAKRVETGMLVCAFVILFFLLAMVGALLVHFTSRLT